MKKIIYSGIMLAALALGSCGKAEIIDETTESISKEVKAETINGETTVTVKTTKNGKEETQVLTGKEAEAYMASNDLENMDHPEGAEVIIKKIENSSSLEIDTDEIMKDPEMEGLDAVTKEKVKKALDNAISDIDLNHTSDEKFKTKVIVIDEDETH
jgi:hypothetical protein